MEDIYTIKVKSNPDPRTLYPSERRYSASTVLGLGVVHLALAATILLLASLSLTTDNPQEINETIKTINLTEVEERNDDVAFLDEDETQTNNFKVINNDNRYNLFTSLTLMPSVMTLGAIAAGVTGLLAWKRWYIDRNIKWFFVMSVISIVTSCVCLVTNCLTVREMIEQRSIITKNTFIFSFNQNNVVIDRVEQDSIQSKIMSNSNRSPSLRLVLAINILIASLLEFIWSVLCAKVAFYGMRNDYPDDIVVSRGKIEVNTVHKGGKSSKVVAPDILNHHPKKRKFVKYFPKIENGFLPKQESNNEYRDRVNKFLSSNVPQES